MTSTNKGFLPPRVTLTAATDAVTIPSPAEGLLVYNVGSVGLQAGYYYWNGASWSTIATASSPNQMVDYVSVMLTTLQSSSEIGQNVKFQTILSGNIPYDAGTGNFSLTAGKTYRLSALASLDGVGSAANSALDLIWRTADGVNIGPLASLINASSNSNYSGQGVVDFIYTPSNNTTVSLYVSYVNNSNTTLRAYSTNAIITQIGSSAIINPWVLSGNDVYNTSGNVGIGTSSPNASAILDISSTTKGITFPRMTSTQSNAISSPTNGLQVFDITTNSIWYFDGSSWINSVSVASFGDIKTGIQVGDHNGWIRLDGRALSTLSTTQRSQAAALGITSNLPNATNAFLVQNETTLGSLSQSNTKTITQANLPNVTLSGTTSTAGAHTHTIPFTTSNMTFSWGVTSGGGAGYNINNTTTSSSSGSHSHTITTNSINGGVTQTDLNITPKSLSVNTFIYLGY